MLLQNSPIPKKVYDTSNAGTSCCDAGCMTDRNMEMGSEFVPGSISESDCELQGTKDVLGNILEMLQFLVIYSMSLY
jgi:hypothetical protein